MYNPVEFSFKIQQATFDSMASAARMMTANYLRLLEQQHHLLQHTFAHHRTEDGEKGKCKKGSPCKGPDLHDHYGKRAHDVDVEHV